MSTSFITEEIPAGDFETITVSNTALGFTAAKILSHTAGGRHKRCVKALVTVEADAIRINFDGSTPTATVGHKLSVGDSFSIVGDQNITKWRMIRVTNDATVSVTYYFNE